MADKEKATSGKLVAVGQSAVGNGTLSHPNSTTNITPPQEVDFDAVLDGNLHTPADLLRAEHLDAEKVAALAEQIVPFEGAARQRALEALRHLIGYTPQDERQAIEGTLLRLRIFKSKKDSEQYMMSCPQPPGAPKFSPMSLSDLLAMPPKDWMIEQVLGRGDAGMLYGPPGSGKTFVVIDLIFSACMGKQFAMRFDVSKPLQVAYCAGEGASGLPARFSAAAERYGVSELPGLTYFSVVPQLFYGASEADELESIERFVREWQERQAAGQAEPLDLLVIDTLHSAAVSAEENSAKDMGRVLQLTKFAGRALGCAVLLIHHSNKAGTGERGSSSLRGAMDCMIEVKPMAGKFSMNCEKLKDGEQWKPQTFDLVAISDSARVWWDEPGEASSTGTKSKQYKDQITEILKANDGGRWTASALGEALGMGKSKRIYALLSELVGEGEQVQSGLKYPDKDSSPHNPLMYWYKDDADANP